jgi:hypothetical protein
LPTAPSELRAILTRPATWHYVSLVAGFAFIVVLQTTQWFTYDEWAFIDGTSLLEAHGGKGGHWSTTPILIYQGLMGVFGLHSYLPYAVVVTITHLVATHLVWRIALRVGASPWIATTAAAVFVVFGTGSENILWAFQTGFIGAVVCGLSAFLLAMSPTMSWRRFAIVLAVSLFSLTWSGTSIPLVVATATILFVRHGWRKAAVLAAVTGAVYLAWYLTFALTATGGVDQGPLGLEKIFVRMPEFIGVLLFFGFGDIFPVPGFGFALLLGVAAWIVVLVVRKTRLPGAAPAFVLLGAAAFFAFMSAYSRAWYSVPSGRSSRYVYLITLLLLPLLTLALSRATARLFGTRRVGIAAVQVTLVALGVYQGALLVQAAAVQSDNELRTQRLMSAALTLYLDDAPNVHLDAWPDPIWAPDIQMFELVELYDEGALDIVDFTPEDEELSRFYLAR